MGLTADFPTNLGHVGAGALACLSLISRAPSAGLRA